MTQTSPSIEFGTNHRSEMIALRGVRLTAKLSGGSLEAALEQTFVNLESKAIEAIYTFPLPETAAVCGFEVRTGDHVLTGTLEESDDALKQYDDAIADGHAAYLLEQDRPDVFTVRAGNLKPKQAATIGISYIAPLERVDRSIRVRFPTTIAPRYVSAAGSTDPLQTAIDADALNPPHVLHVPYGVEMRVEVRLGPQIRGISSPTHRVKAERGTQGGDAWVVEFSGGIADMDRDIVLEIETARETEPQVQVAAGPDDAKYLALTFVPEFNEEELVEPRPSETVFLLDCSGSMQGESIDQATRALELCLRSLNAGDKFNVCRFGSRYELLSKRCAAYSAATLADALRFIQCEADLGGTEIHGPLSHILSQAPSVGGVRNVIVLTDGQVSNEPAVIELARQWKSTNRIFSFGIGSAASGYLVRNLAGATGGAAEFITAGERIEEKVLRTFSRIGSPQVSDVAVRWGDADLQMPAEIPPVFDGDVLRVFARAPGKLPERASLECETPQGRKSWSVAVPTSPIVDGGVIARSWARAMIQSLENSDEPAFAGSRSRRESSVSRRMVSISKQFGILCSRTSLVAVEHRTVDERNAGQPELRRVPVQLAKGWGGLAGLALRDTISSGGYCQPSAAPAPSSTGRFRKSMRAPAADGAVFLEATRGSAPPDPPMCKASVQEAKPADPLFQILAAQTAEGWFLEDAHDVLRTAGHDLAGLEAEVSKKLADRLDGRSADDRRRILETALVLAALRRWYADREAVWRRAARKARHLIGQTIGLDMGVVERLLDVNPATPAAGSP